MVDNEYSSDNYKSLEINITEIIKNTEMLRLLLDHFETKKKMCKNAVKKLPLAIRYIPD